MYLPSLVLAVPSLPGSTIVLPALMLSLAVTRPSFTKAACRLASFVASSVLTRATRTCFLSLSAFAWLVSISRAFLTALVVSAEVTTPVLLMTVPSAATALSRVIFLASAAAVLVLEAMIASIAVRVFSAVLSRSLLCSVLTPILVRASATSLLLTLAPQPVRTDSARTPARATARNFFAIFMIFASIIMNNLTGRLSSSGRRPVGFIIPPPPIRFVNIFPAFLSYCRIMKDTSVHIPQIHEKQPLLTLSGCSVSGPAA